MDRVQLLDGLDAAQRDAVTNPAGPLAILAPAGSGKTSVLTRRIAWRILDGTADTTHVLAITFTRRAADELVRRLGGLGLRDRPTAGTFHSVAWAVLRRRWADQGTRAIPELLTQPERLVAEVLAAIRSPRLPSPGEAATEIGWAHARLVAPSRYESEATGAGRRPTGGVALAAEIYTAYEAAKRAQRLIDFDDLLGRCAQELLRDSAFAEVQRWRFRHLFVDEFQDVNPLQHALLDAWRGDRPDLCVVGDPNQAIYAWNGADPAWLNQFASRHRGATVIRLTSNYRSTPQILGLAGSVLPVDADATDTEAAPAIATRPDGRPPRAHGFADERAEAAGIAAILRAEHVPGRRWASCAVLVRTHAQAVLVERALLTADIPARRRGGQPLLEAPAARRALAEAATYAEPGALRAFVDDLTAEDDPTGRPPAVATLLSLARDFLSADRDGTVESFRVWLALGTGGDDAGAGDAVEIVTFHAAKGLEWPIVVLAGLERGLVPHAGATSREARDEEARLLHVALTRAEHTLHLTWARHRNGSTRTPSPLLPMLQTPPTDDAIPPPPEVRARTAPRDDGVAGALRTWRRSAALAAGLPEQAICTDRALAAVVALHPSSVEELAAMKEIGPIAARRLGPRLLAAMANAELSAEGADRACS